MKSKIEKTRMAPVPWPGQNKDFFFELLGKITLIRRGKEIEKSIDWIGRKNSEWRKENIQIRKIKSANCIPIREHKILQLEKGQFYN